MNEGNGRLSNLQMQYYHSEKQCLENFKSGTSEYTINSILNGQTHIIITSLVPAYATDKVEISYTDSSAPDTDPTSIPYTNYKKEIPVPKPNETLTIKIKVGNGMTTVEYSVIFRNPSTTKNWVGTAVLDFTGSGDYTIEEIKVVTEDGESHDVVIEDRGVSPMKWSLKTGEKNGKPASFTAILKKANDPDTYCVMSAAKNNISEESDYPVTFTVNKDNPIYIEVKSPKQLQSIGNNNTNNYFLANDITLDSSTLGKDWEGPTNYRGHFNGNGKTITLVLAKTSGQTALFSTLADKAIIENFNIEVTTKASEGYEPYLKMTGVSHFGGIVGKIMAGGDYKLRNISITGTLKYNAVAGGGLLTGGLIGEINNDISKIEIENCSAIIDIDFITSTNDGGTVGLGRLIGKSSAREER
ncbi:MAG: hypothetical protein LBH18_01290 [Spirochaetaceae bacterium]|jgi:hypothetical protein|nr:hypothetical protein [Spirochaetaceae bacterium]